MFTRGSYLDRRQLLRGEAILAGIAARLAVRKAIADRADPDALERAVEATRRAFRQCVALQSFLDGEPWRVEGAA